MATLYERLSAAGLELDNHYSDLYVRDTPAARQIIKETGNRLSMFTTCPALGSQRWLEVSFAYDPYWQERKVALAKLFPERAA